MRRGTLQIDPQSSLAGVEQRVERPPREDELEISLFGPGFGEALAIHLGGGEWLLVDSCVAGPNEPASLSYLDKLGVQAEEQVSRIVATHWHDDHIGGLARVVERCVNAELWCSAAIRPREFLALVNALEPGAALTRSGVSEFAAILATLAKRKQRRQRFPSPSWALQDRTIWQRRNHGRLPDGFVAALSPSDGAITLAHHALASAFPTAGSQRRRVTPPRPNHASVVLWVSIGSAKALLGADLEETDDPTTGWTVLLDRCCVPDPPASVFKVPHHGSVTAHQRRVWDELLVKGAAAALTPFTLGGVELPGVNDRRRLCSLTDSVFTTSAGKPRRRRRPKAVEKTLKDLQIRIRDAEPPLGYVRFRRPFGDPTEWNVKLFGPAVNLCAGA